MAFGVYIHIPYCIQRCSYCDFATYEQGKILPPDQYVSVLLEEMKQKHLYYSPRPLDTIYFGGGTPSLLPAPLIVSILKELGRYGFTTGPNTEITIEINPATVSEDKLKIYLENGINRFSVGAQTFDDKLLKMVRREHNARQTLETLELLRKYDLNFSFDILFALPHQTLEGLQTDLEIALKQGAKHLSPYCLTVPDSHPLSKGRALDDEQVAMFQTISQSLTEAGYRQYEISNFAKPGFESQHNLLYWTDQNYWSLGLSAHSYMKDPEWGLRYWNLSSINEYVKQINDDRGKVFKSPNEHLPESQWEILEKHQALTDFCHTSMRLMRGLNTQVLADRFGSDIAGKVHLSMEKMARLGTVELVNGHWRLTPSGIMISNQVFESLTFLKEDI